MASLSPSELRVIADLIDKLDETGLGATAPDDSAYIAIEEVRASIGNTNLQVRLGWDDGVFVMLGSSSPVPADE